MQIYNTIISVAQSRESSIHPKQYFKLNVFVGNDSELSATTDKSARAPLIAIGRELELGLDKPGSLKSRLIKEIEIFAETNGIEAIQPKCAEMVEAIDTIKKSLDKHRANLCFRIKTLLAKYLPFLLQSPEKILSEYKGQLALMQYQILDACTEVFEACTKAKIMHQTQVNEKRKAACLEKMQDRIQQMQNELETLTDENQIKKFKEKCHKSLEIEKKLSCFAKLDSTFLQLANNTEFRSVMRNIVDLELEVDKTKKLPDDKENISQAFWNKELLGETCLDFPMYLELIKKILIFNSDVKQQEKNDKISFQKRIKTLSDQIEHFQTIKNKFEKMEASKVVILLDQYESKSKK